MDEQTDRTRRYARDRDRKATSLPPSATNQSPDAATTSQFDSTTWQPSTTPSTSDPLVRQPAAANQTTSSAGTEADQSSLHGDSGAGAAAGSAPVTNAGHTFAAISIMPRREDAAGPAGGPLDPETAARIDAARSGGAGLDAGVQRAMEGAFGTSFAGVRVHADGEADALNRTVGARAFTTGNDLFFRDGAYQPTSGEGRRLLAHELTHVVQQQSMSVGGPMTVGPANDAHEQQAERMSAAIVPAPDRGQTGEAATIPAKADPGIQRSWLADAWTSVKHGVGLIDDDEAAWEHYQTSQDELRAFMAATHTADNFQPSTGLGMFDATYNPASSTLEIVCKCKFNFVSGSSKEFPDAKPSDLAWTKEEQDKWQKDYLATINSTWSGHHVFYCQKKWWEGLSATVAVKFEVAEGKEHFDLDVTKIPKGGFKRSSVSAPVPMHVPMDVPTWGDSDTYTPGHGTFDSEDLTKVNKPGGSQIGAVHEAGHMLGLDDEYETGASGPPSHSADVQKEFGHEVKRGADGRIMSGGMDILPEHGVTFLEAITKATEIDEWGMTQQKVAPAPPDPSLRNRGDFPAPPTDKVPV